MKVTLTDHEGKSHPVIIEGGTVLVPTIRCCRDGGARLRGTGKHIESHDTYAARAICVCCGKDAGVLRAKMSTIFGLEEDESVLLHGRFRVY